LPTTTRPTGHRPATRSRGDDLRAVTAALRSEWIKASTIRANRAILLLTVAGGLLVSWAVATLVTDEVLVLSEVGFYWTSVSSMLAAIGGVLLFGSEVQHGTLAAAVAARPARGVIALSKTLTAGAMGLVLGAAGLATGFGVPRSQVWMRATRRPCPPRSGGPWCSRRCRRCWDWGSA